MPDHNHGRTGVGDARRPCRLATSNLSFHNALGFGKSPSLQSTTGSCCHVIEWIIAVAERGSP
jgi:hypothetical protein